MKKEVIFNLNEVSSKKELIRGLHEPLALQVHEGSLFESWDAFNDDMSSFNFPTEDNVDEVNIILLNWFSFEKTKPGLASELLSSLAWATDPEQRIDGINFTFQVRLGV